MNEGKAEGGSRKAEVERNRPPTSYLRAPPHRFLVNDSRVPPFVARQCGGAGFSGELTSLGVEQDGEVIAGVVLDHYNGASCCIHVGAKRGAKWLTRDFLSFVFGYSFDGLKLKRLTGLVSERNTAAQKFDEGLGFVREAKLQDAHKDGALLVYRMLKHECRWLKKANAETLKN